MQYETAPLDPYWEFVIHLCPPAGELRIFARDFILQVLEREFPDQRCAPACRVSILPTAHLSSNREK